MAKTSPKKEALKKTVAKKRSVAKKSSKKSRSKPSPIVVKQENSPKKGVYKLSLEVNGLLLESFGDTVFECLDVMGVPPLFKTKGVFTLLEVGTNRTAWITMKPFLMKRLFISKMSKTIFDKRAVAILK